MKIRTAISSTAGEHTVVHGKNLETLAGERPFHEVIFFLLRGEMPTLEQSALFSMMLGMTIDHGAQVPSVVAARVSYSGSGQVNSAVASGINTLGQHHGGAIEGAAHILHDALKEQTDIESAVQYIIDEQVKQGKRIPGYGHKVYKDRDPRVEVLFAKARELNIAGQATELGERLVDAIREEKGKTIPINIDGGLAALLLDLGFKPAVARGFFIIARTPGLVAHVVEEATREKPFRRLEDDEVTYDGV